jgi:hypothetical protein
MRKIYICHPFQGKKSNMQAITHICQRLAHFEVMPISPVHAFYYLNDKVPEEHDKAMGFCKELVEMVDELWLFGEWEKSEGCHIEYTVALMELIPVYEIVAWNGDMPIFARDRMPRWMKKITESGGK